MAADIASWLALTAWAAACTACVYQWDKTRGQRAADWWDSADYCATEETAAHRRSD